MSKNAITSNYKKFQNSRSRLFFLEVVFRETRRRRQLSGGAVSTPIQTKTAGELIVFITDDLQHPPPPLLSRLQTSRYKAGT
jgi:hypothetical protein